MVRLNRLRTGEKQPDEEGAIAVVIALLATVLVLMLALVVDLGLARDTRRQSQNAADASALAAANTLWPVNACPSGGAKPCVADAVAAVKSYALVNFDVSATAWSACTASMPAGYVAMGGTSCIAFNSATNPTKVWVRIPTRDVDSIFAGVIGRSEIAVGSQAEAELGLEVKCSLCFLGAVDAGNADFSVTGGAIAVNGNVNAGPNSYWISQFNGVVGTVNGGVFTPPSQTISPFADPLASLALPLGDSAHSTSFNNPCTQGPGVYNSSFEFPNNGSCTLSAGLYVVKADWGMKNNTVVNAMAGVTLFVPKPGYLDFKNGIINLAAPTSGSFKDLAIVYARDNTNDVSLQGNGSTSITGVVYAPASLLDFNGNSCFGFSQGPVVANGVNKANGTKSCVEISNAKDTTVTRTDLHLSQ